MAAGAEFPLPELERRAKVAVDLSDDDRQLVAAAQDQLRVYDVPSGELAWSRPLDVDRMTVRALTVGDGVGVLTWSAVRVYTPDQVESLPLDVDGYAQRLHWHQDTWWVEYPQVTVRWDGAWTPATPDRPFDVLDDGVLTQGGRVVAAHRSLKRGGLGGSLVALVQDGAIRVQAPPQGLDLLAERVHRHAGWGVGVSGRSGISWWEGDRLVWYDRQRGGRDVTWHTDQPVAFLLRNKDVARVDASGVSQALPTRPRALAIRANDQLWWAQGKTVTGPDQVLTVFADIDGLGFDADDRHLAVWTDDQVLTTFKTRTWKRARRMDTGSFAGPVTVRGTDEGWMLTDGQRVEFLSPRGDRITRYSSRTHDHTPQVLAWAQRAPQPGVRPRWWGLGFVALLLGAGALRATRPSR